jgi:hypothetical protein
MANALGDGEDEDGFNFTSLDIFPVVLSDFLSTSKILLAYQLSWKLGLTGMLMETLITQVK